MQLWLLLLLVALVASTTSNPYAKWYAKMPISENALASISEDNPQCPLIEGRRSQLQTFGAQSMPKSDGCMLHSLFSYVVFYIEYSILWFY